MRGRTTVHEVVVMWSAVVLVLGIVLAWIIVTELMRRTNK